MKILRFFLPWKFVKYWYRLVIKKDPEIMSHYKWMRDNAERFNFQYDLNSDSNVLDLGGYKGDWAYEISKRYNSNIFIFEPVRSFYNNIKKRFKTVEKIHVYNYGVSSSTTNTEIALKKDGSSVFNVKQGSLTEVIRLVDIVQVINKHHFEKIDLIKINIEGGEFEVLPRLIYSKKIKLCKNLLTQFHPIVSDAQTRYENIRKKLALTHHLTFDYPWVWENWKLND